MGARRLTWHSKGVIAPEELAHDEAAQSQHPAAPSKDRLTELSTEAVVGQWLTVPEVAEELGVSLRDVRSMIADREVVATRIGERNVVAIPAAFVQDGHIVPTLMGTVTVLTDGGFSDEEAIRWLCTPDETLPIEGAPIDMLRAGRRAEVRKRAMEEAF